MTNQNRLFVILDLLSRNGKMTASDLASRCRVSETTIQKDIKVLSDAQIAVSSNRGRYKLSTSRLGQQTDLTTDEMLSLYVGLNSGPVQSVRCFREAAKRLLSKIEALMPEDINGDYKVAKKHVAIQPERNRPHQGAMLIFELMRQAIWPKLKVKLHYVSPLSSEMVKLTPKALLYKKDGWYLVGLVHNRIRYFRLDLIKSVKLYQ